MHTHSLLLGETHKHIVECVVSLTCLCIPGESAPPGPPPPPPPPPLLVETMQCNPHLLVEPVGGGALRFPEGTVTETSIPVPVLNWQAAQPTVDGVSLLLSSSVFYWLTLVLV